MELAISTSTVRTPGAVALPQSPHRRFGVLPADISRVEGRGRSLRALAASVLLAAPSAAIAQAPSVAWASERSLVSNSGTTYSVIDLYAQFTQGGSPLAGVNVVNAYEAAITNGGGAAFHHSDLSTLESGPGAWSPTQTFSIGGLNPAIDSFVTIGGAPGGSSTTALDPGFSPPTGPTISEDAGWYNSNPGNNAGASAGNGRTWVGRFVTVATESGTTLHASAKITFSIGGTGYQPTVSGTIDYLPADCSTVAATPTSTAVASEGTSAPVSVAVTTGGSACS